MLLRTDYYLGVRYHEGPTKRNTLLSSYSSNFFSPLNFSNCRSSSCALHSTGVSGGAVVITIMALKTGERNLMLDLTRPKSCCHFIQA